MYMRTWMYIYIEREPYIYVYIYMRKIVFQILDMCVYEYFILLEHIYTG